MATVILVAVLLSDGQRSEGLYRPGDEAAREMDFGPAVLYDGGDGQIWLGTPMVYLGMYGVAAMPPIRLSAQVRGELAGLVTPLEAPPASHDPWIHGLPPRARGDGPMTLVRLNAKLIKVKDDSPRAASRPEFPSELWEVAEARVLSVEFVAQRWRDAWERANDGLNEIVKISRTANPGEDKRRQISTAIERSAEALEAMHKAEVGDEWLARAREGAPDARVVHLFQRHTREQWQSQLEKYAGVLRLPISKALPTRTPPFSPVTLLAESDSPEEFISKVNATWPEDAHEARLIYSPSLRRAVYFGEVAGLSAAQFDTLRAEAKEQIAESERRARASTGAEEPTTRPVSELHVSVGAASSDVLAAKLVLAGVVVEQITDEGPGVDLKAGDLILDYETTHDVAMGAGDPKRSASWLANKARNGGAIQVLRGDRLMAIELPKRRGR